MVEITVNLTSVSMCIYRSYADDFQSSRVLIVFTWSPATYASVAPPTWYECPFSLLSVIPPARMATWVCCRNCAARSGEARGLTVVRSMNVGKPSGVHGVHENACKAAYTGHNRLFGMWGIGTWSTRSWYWIILVKCMVTNMPQG